MEDPINTLMLKQSEVEKDQGNTSHISWSECWDKGSKLYLTVPLKRVGSWGIIPKRDLRSWSPIVEMSMPSTIIFPLLAPQDEKEHL